MDDAIGELLGWPVGIPLVAAWMLWRFSVRADTAVPPWVRALMLPLVAAFGLHTAILAVILSLHDPDPRWWDPIRPGVVDRLDVLFWPVLVPLAVGFVVACACVIRSQQLLPPRDDDFATMPQPRPRWSRSRRRAAQWAAGVMAFAMAIPLQVHSAVLQTAHDRRYRWAAAERARGMTRLAAAEGAVAAAVADDAPLMDDGEAGAVAVTLASLAHDRAYRQRGRQIAFALGVIDALGGGAVNRLKTCLSPDCFDEMGSDTVGWRESFSVEPSDEGFAREQRTAAVQRATSHDAKAQAISRFVARIQAPFATAGGGDKPSTLAGAYVDGIIAIHAAHHVLDGIAIPQQPMRTAARAHQHVGRAPVHDADPKMAAVIKAAERERLAFVDQQLQARLNAERRAKHGCDLWDFSWRCAP